jgi:hypothetical protein
LTARLTNARNSTAVRRGVAVGEDLPGAGVQCGEQVRRAVSAIIMGAFLRLPEVDRQQRLRAVQRLNLGLLVDRQDHRTAGRFQVQPDHVGDLLREPWVLRQLEGALPVRRQPVVAPQLRHVVPGHRDTVDAFEVRGHLPARPVRQAGLRRRRRPGQREDPSAHPARDLLPRRRVRAVFQPGQTLIGIPLDPPIDRRQRHPGQPGDVFTPPTLGHPQHDPSPRRDHRRHIPTIRHRPQLRGLLIGQHHTSINDHQT